MKSFFYFSLSDILQILLSLVGFILAILELRRIKSSFEASNLATEKTFGAMSDRLTIEDIAGIKSGLREIQVALRGNIPLVEGIIMKFVCSLFSELHNLYISIFKPGDFKN